MSRSPSAPLGPPVSLRSPEDDEREEAGPGVPGRGPRRLGRDPVVVGAPRRLLHLRDEGLKARGWLLAVMGAVEAVGRPAFTLAEVYAQEGRLAALYPGNHNVRPKIRQQLQVLRDRGWLSFGDRRGTYRRV